jgi:ABC-type maltose transport system permease subunit
VSLLALIRPDSWNFPLLVHVGGAMILVGGVLTAASALVVARGDGRVIRLGYRALLVVALPGYILMRAGAVWIADKEGYNKAGAPEPDWLGIGFIVADLGALLLLIALVMGAIGASRVRKGTGGEGLLKATMVISIVLLVAYTVAIWAMGSKPS